MGNINASINKGLLWGSGVTIVNAVIQLTVLAVLARFLSPSDFGLVGIGNIVTAFSMLVLEMGVAAAVTQRKTLNLEHKGSAHIISILMSTLVGVLIIAYASLISDFFGSIDLESILPIYSCIFLMRGLSVVPQGLLLRDLKFKELNLIEMTSYFFGYGLVGVGGALYGLGVWSLVFAYFGHASIKTVLINSLTESRGPWRTSKAGLTDVLSFGFGDTLGQLANFLANQLDNILIGKLIGVSALGVYGRAYQISIMPVNLIGGVIQKTLFPAFSRVHESELRSYVIPWLRLTLFIGCYLSFAISIWAEEVVSIVLGSEWVVYSEVFSILACGILFRLLLKFSDTMLRAQGKLYRRALVQMIYAFGVFVAVTSSHAISLNAVCISILIVVIIVGCLNFTVACHSVGITFVDIVGASSAAAVSLLIALVSTYLACLPNFDSNVISLGIFGLSSALGITTYVVLIWKYSNKKVGFV